MIFSTLIVFSGCQGPGQTLASAANLRLWQAFRPSTMTSYMHMFKDFLAFLYLLAASVRQISVNTVLSFMEYLVQAGCSACNVTNYVTALRSISNIFGCDTAVFRDNRIQLFIKAITINRPLDPVLYLPTDELVLSRIIIACEELPHPVVFKALYLFCFFIHFLGCLMFCHIL